MPISKFTTNLYASEVYRELERSAVRKGFFNPSDDQRVKLASEQVEIEKKVNAPVDTSVSGDLTQDVAKLAYALRRKGFISQAEEIETNLIEYKIAEKELYNLNIEQCKNQYDKDVSTEDGELGVIETQESMAKKILEVVNKEPKGTTKQASGLYGVTQDTNKAIIDFAHRDGDVDIVGWGEAGTFETIQSIADKILAVTKKLPKGSEKGESDGFLAVEKIASLIKEGQGIDEKAIYIGKVKESLSNIANEISNISQLFFKGIVNQNGSGTFLHGMPKQSWLFSQLGGDYRIVDNYGKMYKNAFLDEVPQSSNDFSTIIAKNIKRSPEMSHKYIASIGSFEFDSAVYRNDNDKINKMADTISSFIFKNYVAAIKECDKVQQKLADRKNDALEFIPEINKIANMPVTSNDEGSVFSFSSKVLEFIPTLQKGTYWAKAISTVFDMDKNATSIDSNINYAQSLSQELKNSINPNIAKTIDQNNKILNKLFSVGEKLAQKDGDVYQQAIQTINSLISAISNNDQKTLDELGYTDRSLIIVDIDNLARKLG